MYYETRLTADIQAFAFEPHERQLFLSDKYQFLLVRNGSVTLSAENTDGIYTLHEDDIFLCAPNTQVLCEPVPELSDLLLGIQIDSAFMENICPSGHQFICNSAAFPHKDYRELNRILTDICEHNNDRARHKMYSLIFALADCLVKDFCEPLSDSSFSDVQRRIGEIHRFINDRYYQQLRLSDLAGEMYLTPEYLSRFIKKHMNVTFGNYLTEVRLKHACQALKTSSISLTNIALNSGFPNITAFNKAFKEKYGMTPKSFQKDVAEENSAGTNALIKSSSTPVFSDSNVRTIRMDADHAVPFTKTWQDTINIGPLKQVLQADFQEYFLECQKKIRFRYVRFENLFAPEILYYDKENSVFHFNNLDVILDFFREADVVPFVELSYKPPKRLEQEPGEWEKEAWFANEMPDEFYCAALEAVLKHGINRYGLGYMSGWRFEVWLRSAERLTYTEPPQNYIRKYRTLYGIVKGLLPSCMFGGPGYNLCSHLRDFENYIRCFEQAALPMDFVSFYGFCYKNLKQLEGGERYSNTSIVSSDPSYIRDSLTVCRRILIHTMYSKVPVMLTEMSSLIFWNQHITCSLFQAAFLCKNMTELFDTTACTAYLGFYGSPDHAQLLQDSYYLPAGLVRFGGIPHPSFHALAMLSRLGQKLIGYGSSHIMTCNSKNQYQLLLFHYVHFRKSFCFQPFSGTDLKDTYAVFENVPDLKLHICCSHILPGRYKVTRLSLNRSYGSILDKYLRILHTGASTSDELLGMIVNLTEEESAYYRSTCLPRQDIYYMSCGGDLEIDETLSAHEVLFFEFQRML